MFNKILSAIAIQALQVAFCQFFGMCADQDDCPDGVCDELMESIDDLGDVAPQALVSKTRTLAFDFNPDWSKLQPLVLAATEFLRALRDFLGLNRG